MQQTSDITAVQAEQIDWQGDGYILITQPDGTHSGNDRIFWGTECGYAHDFTRDGGPMSGQVERAVVRQDGRILYAGRVYPSTHVTRYVDGASAYEPENTANKKAMLGEAGEFVRQMLIPQA